MDYGLSTHQRVELTFISRVLTDIRTHKSYLCTLELIRLKEGKKVAERGRKRKREAHRHTHRQRVQSTEREYAATFVQMRINRCHNWFLLCQSAKERRRGAVRGIISSFFVYTCDVWFCIWEAERRNRKSIWCTGKIISRSFLLCLLSALLTPQYFLPSLLALIFSLPLFSSTSD